LTRNTVSAATAYPGSIIDAFGAWLYLVNDMKYDPENITLMGDSAGGGVCHVLIMLLMKYKLKKPGKVIFDSPMVNLDNFQPSYKGEWVHGVDILSPDMVAYAAFAWMQHSPPLRISRLISGDDPPEEWDLAGYPPAFVISETFEIFKVNGDIPRFVSSLRARGVSVREYEIKDVNTASPH
jgi:acetyl esterase/lipase